MNARTKVGMAVAAVIGLSIGAGAAYASIPGPDGRIHACYASTNGIWLGVPHSKGDVRIVDSAEACRSYEKAISWTQNPPAPTPPQLPRSLYTTGPLTEAPFATPVLTLNMPVGTWIVSFKGEDGNFPSYCRLTAQAGGFGVDGNDTASAAGTDTGDIVPFTLTARMTFTQPGSATVDCSTDNTDHSHPALILDPVMTAIEVAAA